MKQMSVLYMMSINFYGCKCKTQINDTPEAVRKSAAECTALLEFIAERIIDAATRADMIQILYCVGPGGSFTQGRGV